MGSIIMVKELVTAKPPSMNRKKDEKARHFGYLSLYRARIIKFFFLFFLFFLLCAEFIRLCP